MPTYLYFCKTCNTEKEVFHNMNDKPIIKCPSCKKDMKKDFGGGTGFILKSIWGWATKGNKPRPTRSTEVGVAVDYDKKRAMQEAGEKV